MTMKRLLLLVFIIPSLFAEGISISILNDELYDTDEQLTGAIKLLYQENDHWSFHIGQDIYTPKTRDTLSPILGERPYNAWLYAGVTYQQEADSIETLFSFTFDLGTRGERALGEDVQNGVHDIVGATEVLGWESETANEYGNIFTFMAETSLVNYLIDSRKELTHLSGYIKTQNGTLINTYSVGISAAFGYNTPYYNSEISFPEDDTFYIFGDFQVTFVDENRFLEDNVGYNVIRERYLRKYSIGINWDIEPVRLRFTATTMSEEFTTQAKGHRFGVVEIIYAF
jgi:lipid A 3-O-deacylase